MSNVYIFKRHTNGKPHGNCRETKGSDSNLGDIKHKFKFHSACIGLNFTELSDICQRFNGQQRNITYNV